jgi:hypothetical protein
MERFTTTASVAAPPLPLEAAVLLMVAVTVVPVVVPAAPVVAVAPVLVKPPEAVVPPEPVAQPQEGLWGGRIEKAEREEEAGGQGKERSAAGE